MGTIRGAPWHQDQGRQAGRPKNLVEADLLVELNGNLAAAREKGLIRAEGKDYVIKDGDIVHFLFNV